jgi:aminoglycoside phosphotransferase (APT) family kinase protein
MLHFLLQCAHQLDVLTWDERCQSRCRGALVVDDRILVDIDQVARLLAAQFPQWAALPIRPVAHSGWDNRTFHLGDQMTVRMPSAERYGEQVEKEHRWLPRLAPLLPLQIPRPLALGMPGEGYPWRWSARPC